MVKTYYDPPPTPPVPKPARTCADLGVCQSRAVRCLMCADDPEPWQPDEVECTPFERMAYWGAVIVVSCLTGGTVIGSACFIYGRWFA